MSIATGKHLNHPHTQSRSDRVYAVSIQCQYGGLCANTELGPRCTCPNGTTGLRCETVTDQCQPGRCQNNATCISLINQYACICSPGYIGRSDDLLSARVISILLSRSGTQCEKERDECEPVNPCLNAGRCIDRLNNFSCVCSPGSNSENNEDLFTSAFA